MFKSSFYITIISCFVFLFTACGSDDDSDDTAQIIENEAQIEVQGFGFSQSDLAPQNVYDNIINILNSSNYESYDVVAEVDHSVNAESVDLDLGFTRTIILSNSNFDIPIMEEDIQAGLDLPQKIIVYTDRDNDIETIAAYNTIDYLSSRYNVLRSVEAVNNAYFTPFNDISDIALEGLDSNGSASNSAGTSFNEGIITVTSNNDFNTTYDNIIAELNNIAPISIIAEIDHQMNAADIGVELNSSRLVVFGNPALGTPLMQESITIAVDLPQKMLIYEDDMGQVNIIYNDPFFIAERHDVVDNDTILTTISGALMNIANAGAL